MGRKVLREVVISFTAVLFTLVLSPGSHAQQLSDADTIRVADLSGEPGDTVNVPMLLVNTFEVSGISFRVEVEPAILKPLRVDSSGTRVENVYNYFLTHIDTADGSVFWLALNWNDPQRFYVEPGSGVIAYLTCVIQPGAPAGYTSPIEFVDDSLTGHITALSDTAQETNMIVPTKDGGLFSIFSVGVDESEIQIDIPSRFFLSQISPNPFSDETTIRFGCPGSIESRHMTIKVYDATGRMVRTLFDGPTESGYHSLKWKGETDEGSELPGGVYFCKMNVRNGPEGFIRKVVLLK